jgi:hypothetical protein
MDDKEPTASNNRLGFVVMAVAPRAQHDSKSLRAWYNASDRAARSSKPASRLRNKIPTDTYMNRSQPDMCVIRHSQVLTAGGKYVIACNIERTLPSAATPFDGTNFVKRYRQDRSAAMPRGV